MTGMRKAALAAITLLVAAASLTSFAESYRALFDWASHHGLHGLWAAVWPLQVDVFIAVGELALFVALADRWNVRSRAGAWTVAFIGLAVSVAGNIGHIGSHDWASRATAAVPPLAAAAALAVGLGVLKRVVGSTAAAVEPETADVSADRSEAVSAPLTQTVLLTGPQTDGQTGAAEISEPDRPALPGPVPDTTDGPSRPKAANRTGKRSANRSAKRATDEDAEREFAPEIAAGQVPSLYQIRNRLHVGNDRAKLLRQHIARQALSA